jgi:hypothetical protein
LSQKPDAHEGRKTSPATNTRNFTRSCKAQLQAAM